jgi:hypothetical protein
MTQTWMAEGHQQTATYSSWNGQSDGNDGTVWQIKDAVNSANLQTFAYDSMNRLTSATGGSVSQQYSLDSFGNVSRMSGGSPISMFSPSTNRVSSLPCSSAFTPYDGAGNQLCDTNQTGGANMRMMRKIECHKLRCREVQPLLKLIFTTPLAGVSVKAAQTEA